MTITPFKNRAKRRGFGKNRQYSPAFIRALQIFLHFSSLTAEKEHAQGVLFTGCIYGSFFFVSQSLPSTKRLTMKDTT